MVQPDARARWRKDLRAVLRGPFLEERLDWAKRNAGDSLTPNGFGLHHMHGNLWEWCRDTYYGEFYRSRAAADLDSVNASDGGPKVLRGGSWARVPAQCRSALRMTGTIFIPYHDCSFRPVWSFYPVDD